MGVANNQGIEAIDACFHIAGVPFSFFPLSPLPFPHAPLPFGGLQSRLRYHRNRNSFFCRCHFFSLSFFYSAMIVHLFFIFVLYFIIIIIFK